MRVSIGTAVVLMAIGGVLAFAVDPPAEVETYIDVLDLGLILVWTGLLVLAMAAYMYRPRRPRRPRDRRYAGEPDDPWRESDVHRPGYAGETRRLPTVRGDRDR
jgi:hypothetical protein